ncbi:MAG: hypothetical protein WBB23_25905 [Desulforhopalus sp.]
MFLLERIVKSFSHQLILPLLMTSVTAFVRPGKISAAAAAM